MDDDNDAPAYAPDISTIQALAKARNEEEAKLAPKKYLTAKFQMGSCKGPIFYPPDENCFHSDDIPAAKKEIKKQVMEMKKNKILRPQGEWEASTLLGDDGRVPHRQRATNSVHDRGNLWGQYNYRAERLPPTNQPFVQNEPWKRDMQGIPPKQQRVATRKRETHSVHRGQGRRNKELLVHPKLEKKTPWASSTLPSGKERRANQKRIDSGASANSARRKAAAAKKEYHQYVSPQERYEQDLKARRIRREAGIDESCRPIDAQPSIGTLPDGNLPPSAASVELIPQAKVPTRKYRTFKHSGVWEMNEREGKMMWSDTGSFIHDSPGDIVRVVDPDAMNFAAP